MRTRCLVIFFAIALSAFAQTEHVNIPGFGDLPYIKNDGKFSMTFDKIGKLDFEGSINPLSLETFVKMEQLKDIKGYKTISKLNLENLKIKVSQGGLFLDAEAKTDGALKTLCQALKITAPRIGISTLISKNAFALSGELDFSSAPIVIDVVPKLGTRMTLVSLELGANVGIEYPGKEASPEEKEVQETNKKNKEKKKKNKGPKVEFSPSIYVRTEMKFRPTSSDPDLKIITEFDYDLITQEITGAGSMVDTWSNPLGLSKILPENSISMTNTAMEIGWIPGSPSPTNIGFYLEKGKFFHMEFAFGLSVAPADGSVALMAERNRIGMNDFTRILREGFGLEVPDVFPQDIFIDSTKVLFAPTGGKVGEFEIEQGFAMKGRMKMKDAMEASLDFKLNGEEGFYLDVNMETNFKQAMIDEIKKVKYLGPVLGEVLQNFEVKEVNLHLEASKDLVFVGKTHCYFRVMNQDVKFDFEGKLDIGSIKDKLIAEIKRIAGPKIAAIADAVKKVVGPAVNASLDVAKKGYEKMGYYAKHGKTLMDHGKHDNCKGVCVPNRANELTGAIFEPTNSALTMFYEKTHNEVQQLVGSTPYETVALRKNALEQDWHRLVNELDNKWKEVINDDQYQGYKFFKTDVIAMGNEYRRFVNIKYQEHRKLRRELWRRLLTHGNGTFQIQNRNVQWAYLHENWGKLESSSIKPEWVTAQWEIEPVYGTQFFRIKNAATEKYLNVEHGKLESGPVGDEWFSAQWTAEIVPGTKYVRIKNRWKETYIHTENGPLECSPMKPEAWNSQWDFVPLLKSVDWNSYGWFVPVEFNEFARIKNVAKKGYINNQTGPVVSSQAELTWQSAQWVFEPSPDPSCVRIKNRWKGTYLTLRYDNGRQKNVLVDEAINENEEGAQWDIFRASKENNYYKIRNRWKDDWYLHEHWGKLEAETVDHKNWPEIYWEIDYVIDMAPITVLYDQTAGCGTFYKNGSELKKHCGWSKNWHTILVIGGVGNSLENSKVLFYDQNAGVGAIYKVDNAGNMQLLKNYSDWSKGWSSITWETSDGCNGVIKFEAANGSSAEYKCDDSGNLIPYQPLTVKYDAAAGCGTIYRGDKQVNKHCGWAKTWHSIVRVSCDNEAIFLFYEKNAGVGAFYRFDDWGGMILIKKYENFSKDWTKISWEPINGDCHGLITFKAANGSWAKYKYDDSGNIKLISQKQ